MRAVIYLVLYATGFYFGKWFGAIGLVCLYFFFFHSRQLAKKSAKTPRLHTYKTDVVWAYRLLEVPELADKKTIQKARKKLLNQYHPDKLGLDKKDEKRAAEQKIHQINQAYQAIKKDKGFK